MAKNNRRVILVSSTSASGKTASLRNIKEKCLVLNCDGDSGDLPFNYGKNFTIRNIAKPKDVLKIIKKEGNKYDYVVVDTLTFLMDMFESKHIIGSANTMEGWMEYAEFFRELMLQIVPKCTANIIIMAHTAELSKDDVNPEIGVKIKGSVMSKGVEAVFNNVISCKKIPIEDLDEYLDKKLLKITKDDELRGFKYVFQTLLSEDTVGERIRSPMGMWKYKNLYIDNDITLVMDRLAKFYNGKGK